MGRVTTAKSEMKRTGNTFTFNAGLKRLDRFKGLSVVYQVVRSGDRGYDHKDSEITVRVIDKELDFGTKDSVTLYFLFLSPSKIIGGLFYSTLEIIDGHLYYNISYRSIAGVLPTSGTHEPYLRHLIKMPSFRTVWKVRRLTVIWEEA